MRNTTISICKALAIILMVAGHAECPAALSKFLFEFHMPVFFATAGYFFSLKYLNDEATFVKKRLRGLYLPFLKWSVFFLIIHNTMFRLGILNEQYGNAAGGVTHPYTWHQIQQNLWTMVTAMGGYDQFLCGAFWFFRALLVTSILYLIIYKGLHHLTKRLHRPPHPLTVPIAICLLMLLLGAWKTAEGIKIVTIVQGGYREIMGTFFFGCGFLFRQLQPKYRPSWWGTIVFAAIVWLFSEYYPSNMGWRATFEQFVRLPLPAVCGILLIYNVSTVLDRHDNLIRRFLVYCGDHTLYIFVFHILAFKAVNPLKIWYYQLDWAQMGCHLVIHHHSADDYFWLLYTLAGVALPLLGYWGYTQVWPRLHSKLTGQRND
ncbi:MAG: acyltransferase family protein [Prevotella sp.]|nr:acyltransferase family protein [Prevotella sp.]